MSVRGSIHGPHKPIGLVPAASADGEASAHEQQNDDDDQQDFHAAVIPGARQVKPD
jgi:hypothetical protein